MARKPTHFETCVDENCERRWCVDRRNAPCSKDGDCTVEKDNGRRGRCVDCHTEYVCTSYGWCDLHGEHGP